MPRLSLGLGVQTIRKVGGGAAPITTSRAFNSSGGQVGSTNTGDIPSSWVENEATVTSVIFANNNSVTIIGSSAFYGCTGLTNITIPNGVTTISEQSFRGCTNLSSITIPDSVTSIGSYAFYGCSNITTITIPSGVTSIGGYAFQSCNSLATVLCYVAQSAFVGNEAFSFVSPLTIRARSTDASWTAGTGLSFQGNLNVTVIKNL